MNGAHLEAPVSGRDHIQGNPQALVTLVEYGDYECPYCASAVTIVKALQDELGDRLCYVFRHFPLSRTHRHARMAAEAAEAAGAQGEFWRMHDTLFENQTALMKEDLIGYCLELGLDERRFRSELDERTHASRIEEDFQSGLRSGVNGTPSFFINGIRHDAPWDFDTLLKSIRAALPGVKAA